jgi:SAM-dependent methyltransferase
MVTERADARYVLGHSREELARLALQAQLYGPATRRFLHSAGIRPGMRVLDLGSGGGDVALLLAELVTPSGEVLGVDVSRDVVRHAQARARRQGHHNIRFMEGDFRELDLGTPFDAAVGRMVLMYLSDPTAALRSLTRHVRECGIVAFQELDFSIRGLAHPPSPLYARMGRWSEELLARAGTELRMGLKLPQVFVGAGLPFPDLVLESPVGGGDDWPGFEFVATHLRCLLPRLVEFGVATEAEVDIDNYEARLRAEITSLQGTIALRAVVGAWTRKTEAVKSGHEARHVRS